MYMNFDELEAKCIVCNKCPLCKTRTKVVFGVGNRNADVLFIGEGPGKNEDLLGEPFVGRSGQLLDKMLEAIDLDRKKNIYIANIVKCRPAKNRDPFSDEQEACINWLKNQIELINPKIVVCLGRIASAKIIKPDIKIMKEHGIFFQKGDILFMGTLHPAALLTNPNNKPTVLKDFLDLRDKMRELNCII